MAGVGSQQAKAVASGGAADRTCDMSERPNALTRSGFTWVRERWVIRPTRSQRHAS